MKLSKQKIWSLIQMLIVAYLVISSCANPDKSDSRIAVIRQDINEYGGKSIYKKAKKTLPQIQPVFKPTIETPSFSNTFFIKNP